MAKRTVTVEIPVEKPSVPRVAYSLEEAAEALGIGRTLAYDEARAGRLKVTMVGSLQRVSVENLKAYANGFLGLESSGSR